MKLADDIIVGNGAGISPIADELVWPGSRVRVLEKGMVFGQIVVGNAVDCFTLVVKKHEVTQ